MTTRQTLLIDFDGVLHSYTGWTGPIPTGPPIDKARAALLLLSKTYRIVIFTTRPAEQTKDWLRRYGFPDLKVTNIKEPAHLIIDDRAITFPGTWSDELLSRITSFNPHWHQDAAPPPDDSPVSEPPLTNASHPDKQYPSEVE